MSTTGPSAYSRLSFGSMGSEAASAQELVVACLAKDPAAREEFARRYRPVIRAAAMRVLKDAATADDVVQELMLRLLDGTPSSPPRLSTYSGKGSIEGWLRVVAAREAVHVFRVPSVEKKSGALDDNLAEGSHASPELHALQARCRPVLTETLRAVLKSLPDRDRSVLRLAVVEGVGIEALARMFNVHRTTMTRWVQDARDLAMSRARTELAKELRLSEQEIESYIRFAREEIDTSFSSALR